ncbi:MAG: 50S ribosomal protein L22 [Eubacteriaceae bacterium]|nr:50S ribosomal protein L22 [Eubacteriaceae bacterium]
MEAKATAKHLRISPIKVKRVIDLIKGKNLKEAKDILEFTSNNRASHYVKKVVNSAAANAENNHNMNLDSLYVFHASANQGKMMRRYKAGSMGRANPIIHRTTHITVVLKERE